MAGVLEGKVGLITGAAVGIGRAAALAFAREGARVVLADVLVRQGEETADLICRAGGQAIFVRCDVAQSSEVAGLVAQAVKHFGRLDCAFNNAGVEGDPAPTADATEENWERVINVNLKGVWLCMKYELAQMLKQGRGAIVNTASVAGLVAERGLSAYAAAKGGVIQLTRTAAVEYATSGVRVNAICPGAIMTPMIDRSMSTTDIHALMPSSTRRPAVRRFINSILRTQPARKVLLGMLQPMGRPGLPEEVAAAAVWLCSDAAGFVTGHSLVVDGGLTAA